VTIAGDFAAIERRVRESFAKQSFMATIGATVSAVRKGEVEIVLPFSAGNTQQHGFVHGGVVASIADSACGYAALTAMPADSAVLSVEFKINFLSPAKGEKLRAHGRVVRAGKKLVVSAADVFSVEGAREKQVAFVTATMMVMETGSGMKD
jgi:uncharacterized protein (TIGR00369 family)